MVQPGQAYFVIDDRQRIVEWSYAASMVLGIEEAAALGRPCYEVLHGKDPFGKVVCRPECQAVKALQEGDLTASCSLLLASQENPRKKVLAELVALPDKLGGAVAVLTERIQKSATSGANDGVQATPDSSENKTQYLVRDLAALTTLASSLSPDNLEKSIEQSLDWLSQATNMEAAELFLVEPQGADMLLTAYRGPFRKAFSQITRFSPGEGFPGLVKSLGKPIVSNNLTEDDRYLRTQVKARGFHSYVSVPLTGSGEVIGVLNVATRRPNPDLERVVRLLTWASQPISTVLQLGLLQVREKVGSVSAEVLPDSEQDFDTVLSTVLQRMMLIGNASGGTLTVYDWDAHGAVRRVSGGEFADVVCPDVKAQDPHMCPVMVSGHDAALTGPRYKWPLACRHLQARGGAVYCLPLLMEGERVGMVQLGYVGNVPSPETGYLAALLTAAGQAALIVKKAWKNHQDKERTLRLQSAMMQASTGNGTHGNGPSVRSAGDGDKTGRALNMPFLDIRCLGGFELYRDGRLLTPEAFQRRGALTVLKILLLHCGRLVHRDTLVEALWPEVDPQAGVNRLHVLLHALRRNVEPAGKDQPWLYICNDGDSYYFNQYASFSLDVNEFRGYIGLAERLERDEGAEAAIDAYEAGVSLYRGDLLEDEVYAEWCWGEREHLRETCLAALNRLATFYLKHDALGKSIERYRQALRMDVLREENHRGLMHALWLADRRDEALRQYQVCRDVLSRELDVGPLQETEELYSLIRNSR